MCNSAGRYTKSETWYNGDRFHAFLMRKLKIVSVTPSIGRFLSQRLNFRHTKLETWYNNSMTFKMGLPVFQSKPKTFRAFNRYTFSKTESLSP